MLHHQRLVQYQLYSLILMQQQKLVQVAAFFQPEKNMSLDII